MLNKTKDLHGVLFLEYSTHEWYIRRYAQSVVKNVTVYMYICTLKPKIFDILYMAKHSREKIFTVRIENE